MQNDSENIAETYFYFDIFFLIWGYFLEFYQSLLHMVSISKHSLLFPSYEKSLEFPLLNFCFQILLFTELNYNNFNRKVI